MWGFCPHHVKEIACTAPFNDDKFVPQDLHQGIGQFLAGKITSLHLFLVLAIDGIVCFSMVEKRLSY